MKRAIKTHLVDFVAILVLILLAIVVSAYVLNHERLPLPFINPSTFALNADFSSAKAVTAGQGQSVQVSGVIVGSISGVHVDSDGTAEVQMTVNQQYKHLIHTDATALLRPKTGLDDMFIQLNPGTRTAPLAKPGFTIPVSQTNPVVDPDEILSSLDADTRAYLDLLVNGAGQGLKGKGGSELAQVLERFLPTHRSLAELNSVVAERGHDLQSLIHSLQVLNTAVATKRSQLVSLVDASSKVFHAFALANRNVSRAVADLPGTLNQTTSTLGKVQRFANLLAPATRNLLPAARAIPAANAATISLARPITPVLEKEIRPFVRDARPLVRNLKPASNKLAKATPNLSKTFNVLNHLFNILGYFPGGQQHGYLWWLAWGSHDARTLFSVQDANGDFRPLFLQASCATYGQIVQNLGPLSSLALNLAPILGSTKLCPNGGKALDSSMKAYEMSLGAKAQSTSGSSYGSGGSSSSTGGGSGTTVSSSDSSTGASSRSSSGGGSGSPSSLLNTVTSTLGSATHQGGASSALASAAGSGSSTAGSGSSTKSGG
jgi:phospholipid/cholesterol/gamma-HCH transport system substrate-binding protein